ENIQFVSAGVPVGVFQAKMKGRLRGSWTFKPAFPQRGRQIGLSVATAGKQLAPFVIGGWNPSRSETMSCGHSQGRICVPGFEVFEMIMIRNHDLSLVFLSIVIATFASFTSLSLASRVRASNGWMRRFWLTAASIALGGGIWAMHFIGMLAFSMPGMELSFEFFLTLLSLAIAIAFTGAGFAVLNWEMPSTKQVLAAGLLMGSGIVAMHYLGMAAMRMTGTLSYDRTWIALSILIAISAATTGVWLAAHEQAFRHRAVASGVMGLAIAGMHYAGMNAAVFTAEHVAHERAGVGQSSLAMLISMITVLILALALGAAWLERLLNGFERREARIALRLKVADVLRAPVPEQSLEELVALMGAHFRVCRAGYGQLDPTNDVFDYNVCWTDGTVPPLLGRFPAGAFGVKIVAALAAGQTVAIQDLQTAELSDELRTGDTARELETRAILVVPFVHKGHLRTIVYLNSREPRSWHREDVAFMEEIAERTRWVVERAAVEEELRQLNLTLEARVEARTSELREAQDALLQSQKMEAVGQLVSGLAHDFNNVLGAIVGAFDLIRRRPDDPDRVKRFAEAGLQASERGSKLTGQLLAFSRSQRIQVKPLFVCDVINEIRDLLVRTLGRMIRLEFELNPAPVAVLADPTQVEMMVLNLAINGRDAMPEGGVLKISTEVVDILSDREVDEGQYVEISVTDTGIGMDEVTLRRAMEPFFTTKPVGMGTGLGLSQIYGSARQAGGTVRIQSYPGAGTTVRVLLPCTKQTPESNHNAYSTFEARTDHAPLIILLVDDDLELRSLLVSALQSQGHQVHEASDGIAALATLETVRPDIAVIDFAMPIMNGAELARRIAEQFPELPIIFASGYADTDAIESAVGSDAIMIRKPFRVDELLSALSRGVALRNK
ncbi:response regulator, partial [bacterium]